MSNLGLRLLRLRYHYSDAGEKVNDHYLMSIKDMTRLLKLTSNQIYYHMALAEGKRSLKGTRQKSNWLTSSFKKKMVSHSTLKRQATMSLKHRVRDFNDQTSDVQLKVH